MRRSASETLRNLEMRVARLEKQSSRKMDFMDLRGHLTKSLEKAFRLNDIEIKRYEVEMGLISFFSEKGIKNLFKLPYVEDDYSAYHDLSFKVGKRSLNRSGTGLNIDLEVIYSSSSVQNVTKVTLSVDLDLTKSSNRGKVEVKKVR